MLISAADPVVISRVPPANMGERTWEEHARKKCAVPLLPKAYGILKYPLMVHRQVVQRKA